MKQTLIRTLLLLVGCMSPAIGEVTLEGFYWMMEPSGTGSLGQNSIVGTRFDLQQDLGFGETENIVGATVVLGGPLAFGASFMNIDIEAQRTIEQQINFQDLSFTARSDLSSLLETSVFRGFVRAGKNDNDLAIAAEAGVIYADVTAAARASGVGNASVSVSGGTVYAGGHVKMPLGPHLGIQGGLRFSSWSFEDFEYDYLEFEISGRVKFDPLFGGAGYRSFKLDGKDSAALFALDLELTGPIIYAGFTF
ncbi:MAG: hypothetical protein ACI9TH_000705 [Kiritimatiellia bacterium]|jgi:hypothetical protein